MNTRILVLVGILLFVGSASAQEMNKKYHDPELDREVLVGYCDMIGIKKGEFGEIYKSQYNIYEADPIIVQQIQSILNEGEYKIISVFGDWCSDSEFQLPNFYKVLDKVSFANTKRKLIAVDRSKNAQVIDLSEYDIQLVPTFIIYLKGEEIGRIIESPNDTLEKDLLAILKQKD